MLRVILAEDHKLVRQGTRLYLENQGIAVVGEAENGREAVELTRKLQPDVAVLDIRMPELTGIEATRRIRAEAPDVRVLILSAYDEAAYVHALLEAGADGFILKSAELHELYSAICEVADGGRAFDNQVLKKAQHHLEGIQYEALTGREVEVLQQAAQGLSNKEIGALLYISDRTVQGHLQNIYQKLGVASRTEAVTKALEHGIITLADRR